MSSTGSGQYAFMIETRDNRSRSWSWISDYGRTEGVAAGRGVEDDAPGDPRAFARATLDAYLDHLVDESSSAAAYYLYEDEDDTEWRIRVWNIPATGYDEIATVPAAGDPLRLNYPLAMSAEKLEPHSVVTLPGRTARNRLHTKHAAHTTALRQSKDSGGENDPT